MHVCILYSVLTSIECITILFIGHTINEQSTKYVLHKPFKGDIKAIDN